jgi:DNA ligase-1
MIQKFPTLYKRDSKGKLRKWRAEVLGAQYRTVSGLADGQQVTSEWKATVAKNVGRANATTAEEQAIAEVEAIYTKRLDGEYHTTAGDIDKARFFKPMLAAKWEDRKDKIDYPVYVQPKLDGIRCIANRDGLWSRTGKQIVACPHIETGIASLFVDDPDLVLDGELYTHEYKDDFNKIISMVRKSKPDAADLTESAAKVRFHVYDLPSDDRVFSERTQALASLILGRFKDSLAIVTTMTAMSEDEVDDLFGEFVEQGYEGGIIRLNTLYEQKRSKGLLKRKDFEDAEFKIVSIEEGKGNWAGYAKRVIFQLEDGRECGAGLAGNQDFARQLLSERDSYVGGQVTVQYFTRTPDGMPRFPIAKALYAGKRDV